ncbi:MAG: OmpA family protein [Gammaproteobacteria bacterium]|nr:OmpA family protein [Gammaproteobacteria bacterium]
MTRWGILRAVLLLVGLLTLPFAGAATLSFGRDVNNAEWTQSSSRDRCTLEQSIPRFGVGQFVQEAGELLRFEYVINHHHRPEGDLRLLAMPPLWRHDRQPRIIVAVSDSDGNKFVRFEREVALEMMQELETGMLPTLEYRSPLGEQGLTRVTLEALKFTPALAQFQACLTQLYPYRFGYVENSEIFFASGRVTLGAEEINRLNQIIAYVKADEAVQWIELEGYADERGLRRINDELSQKRTEAVKSYLLENGVSAAMITAISYGERKPRDTNRSQSGRQNNRVVVMQLHKSPPPTPEEIDEQKPNRVPELSPTLPDSAMPSFKPTPPESTSAEPPKEVKPPPAEPPSYQKRFIDLPDFPIKSVQ